MKGSGGDGKPPKGKELIILIISFGSGRAEHCKNSTIMAGYLLVRPGGGDYISLTQSELSGLQ